jgi:hypothetical protein
LHASVKSPEKARIAHRIRIGNGVGVLVKKRSSPLSTRKSRLYSNHLLIPYFTLPLAIPSNSSRLLLMPTTCLKSKTYFVVENWSSPSLIPSSKVSSKRTPVTAIQWQSGSMSRWKTVCDFQYVTVQLLTLLKKFYERIRSKPGRCPTGLPRPRMAYPNLTRFVVLTECSRFRPSPVQSLSLEMFAPRLPQSTGLWSNLTATSLNSLVRQRW